jgi:hypothetical protein
VISASAISEANLAFDRSDMDISLADNLRHPVPLFDDEILAPVVEHNNGYLAAIVGVDNSSYSTK